MTSCFANILVAIDKSMWALREAILSEKCSFFFNIVQKAFAPPPPFYLNICPILQGVFFVEAGTSNVF